MTATAMGGFPARPQDDRNAFLVLTLLIWAAVLSGFGTDSVSHVMKHGLDYPWIVHVHAVAFVMWLVVFTAQVALIRSQRLDLHKRLGVAAVGLAVLMLVIGPATALSVHKASYLAHGETPEFLGVQFTDIAAFAGLTGAGLLSRGTPSAHKRLVMLGLIYISDAGFSRFLNPLAMSPFGDAPLAQLGTLYLGNDLLMLGLGAYDLVTRRRLHPAYVGGVVYSLAMQATGVFLVLSPAWKALTLKLIGQ